jgi:hypothetical protein
LSCNGGGGQEKDMLRTGCVFALAADIDLAEYERPARIIRRIRRWLIVSCLGPDSEQLSVSDTGVASSSALDAPIGLTPARTLHGVLASRSSGSDCTFLLSRQQPQALALAGIFFPAEGYVRIHEPEGGLRVEAEGRHAHSCGRRDGRRVLHDVAFPAPEARFAMAWHVNAVRRPWTGEFFPSNTAAP